MTVGEPDDERAAGVVLHERAGLVPPVIDTQLAAIALAHGYAIATRDTVFERLGVERIDPWTES